MVEILGISLMSPIVKKGIKKLASWIKERRAQKKQAEMVADEIEKRNQLQKQVNINIQGPIYSGYSNHWLEGLMSQQAPQEDVNYSYLGNQINSEVEVNNKLSVLKLNIPHIDKDLLREVIMKKLWKVQNDKKHGNGVFKMAIPQQTNAKFEDEVVTFTAEGLGSVPINGRYMFNKELSGLQINENDPNPEDFYRAGGKLEIPVEVSESGFSIFPVAPPPPKIPEYATRIPQFMNEEVISPVDEKTTAAPFIFCPLCGAKLMTGGNLVKFCMVCGKSIEKFMQ
ncbi:MAG: hypothetical protein GF383_02365 [Candidatus Lokiarchaeota archaeon]|nr:hypothetical protein [Candidatus Lokiarchaeota archaeon]MBD3338253.1 hypothetical protein [Candidatus Lokiarchaeota archaeon]